MINRRKFIRQSLAAAGAISFLPTFAQSKRPLLLFDCHTHPGLFPAKGSPMYPGDDAVVKTINQMNQGELTGAFFSLIADAPLIKMTPTGIAVNGNYNKGDGWKEYTRQIAIMKNLMKTMPVSAATTGADLKRALGTGKVAAFISSEGGDFLEGDAGRLEEMYNDGVRSVQIVHYHPNELGDLQTENPSYNGLSAAGKDVVKRMNKLKMLIDVAHASEETVRAVASTTDAPLMLSHSSLRTSVERPIWKRTITADHARVVAGTKGAIGVWPSGYHKSFEDFIDNTKRLVDVVGVDHVALGTDMDGNFQPVITSYLDMPKWASAIRGAGFNEEETAKITGLNMLRVLRESLGS